MIGWTLGGYLPYALPRDLTSENFPSNQFQSEDEKWMFIALLEGMKGCGISNPNPSVGCVIVKDGKQIAAGSTEAYKLRHAERVAISQLPKDFDYSACTAYVTLEPCSHQGHQPPCVDLLIEKKMGRVVIAIQDPNPKVAGAGLARLKATGIPTSLGILKQEAQLWHFPFMASHSLGRPVWVGKWAQTKNGLLATDQGEALAITGAASRSYNHWLRQKYDAILVGAGTVLRDYPSLTVRESRSPLLRQPLRIVVDAKGRINEITDKLRASTFSDAAETVLIMGKNQLSPRNLPSSVHLVKIDTTDLVPALQEWVTTPEATQFLGKPLQSIYVEGGPTLHNLFLDKNAYDVLHVFKGEKVENGSRYRIPFEKYKTQYRKVTELAIQKDTLQEYLLLTKREDGDEDLLDACANRAG